MLSRPLVRGVNSHEERNKGVGLSAPSGNNDHEIEMLVG